MKRLAIIVASMIIFSLSYATLDTQFNLNKKFAQTPQPELMTETVSEPVIEKTIEQPKPKQWPELSISEKIKQNPNKCDLTKQQIWASDGSCHDLPTQTSPATKNVAQASSGGSGSGSCAAEIAKYNWPQNIANAVMLAESSGNAGIVNDNPATGDYSIGCFQVNIKGSNARTRPSEAQLKNAAINVEWSYNHYVALGRTFGTSGGWGAYTAGHYLKYL